MPWGTGHFSFKIDFLSFILLVLPPTPHPTPHATPAPYPAFSLIVLSPSPNLELRCRTSVHFHKGRFCMESLDADDSQPFPEVFQFTG